MSQLTGTPSLQVERGLASKPMAEAPLISSVAIRGLARGNEGNPLTLTVPRVAPIFPPVSECKRFENDAWHIQPGGSLYPDRLEGGIELALDLGEELYRGKASSSTPVAGIYDVTVVSKHAGIEIPPLVAKVSKQTQGRWLSNEAGVYKLLEPFQGTIIPRCYGYFRCHVNLQMMTVVPWDPDCQFPRGEFDVYDMPHTCATLNILLLEKLGRPLSTLGVKRMDDREKASIGKELLEMFNKTARYGVGHDDFAERNILEAPANVGPGYRFRLVDWDKYEDSNWAVENPKAYRNVVMMNLDSVFENELRALYG
ncbi:hypothetical protein C8Q77DRAFT_1074023 [Trametes polyzona]|nr:hypothetical protein C8Q77DRAFT_1074023 [Trametes polyzona]